MKNSSQAFGEIASTKRAPHVKTRPASGAVQRTAVPLNQRVGIVDDLLLEISREVNKEPSFPPGLRHCIAQLVLSSETARMAALLSGPVQLAGTYLEPLLAAARQAHETARRHGRCDPVLLMLLRALTQAVERMYKEAIEA